MDFENAWNVVSKDFAIFKNKKSILYTLIILPVVIGIAFPIILIFIHNLSQSSYVTFLPFFNALLFWFIILAAVVPVAVASYSIVGEKLEKTLEPLLATPLTDGEIILGKTLSVFIPCILATYLGAVVFMIGSDIISFHQLGYILYPNWTAAVYLLVAAPLACIFGTEFNMLVSIRVTDPRTAQNYGGALYFPLLIVFILGEAGVITLDIKTILIFSFILLVVGMVLFYINKSIFHREEILTKYT
ncbi:MAG: ABC transporter permease subunit [Methanobacterium sp.]